MVLVYHVMDLLLTFSPFYMGNHTKPWEVDDDMGMNPSSYTLSENWGFQVNFMVPLDKRGLEQSQTYCQASRGKDAIRLRTCTGT